MRLGRDRKLLQGVVREGHDRRMRGARRPERGPERRSGEGGCESKVLPVVRADDIRS